MKWIKGLILFLIVTFSIFNIYCSQNSNVGNYFLYANKVNYYKGDLFEISKVSDFKEKITKYNIKEQTIGIQDCDIITMGDSFFTADFDSPIFSEQLATITGKAVFNVEKEKVEKFNNSPIDYLKSINFQKGSKKYIIIETVERYSIEKSSAYVPNDDKATQTASSKADNRPASIFSTLSINKVKFDYFFYNSVFFAPITEQVNTMKFRYLKEIDKRTPIYSENPKELFYYDEEVFAKRDKNDGVVDYVANNIDILKKELKERYNLEMIYVIIPDKYSIYGETANEKNVYDNYIPRLVNNLKKRGITTFDLYSIYNKEKYSFDKPIYYKGETHFAPYGKELTIKEVIKLLK